MMEGGFSACRHGRSGGALVGGGIGQHRVGILTHLLSGAMQLRRKNLSQAAFTLAFNWLSGCPFPFFTPQLFFQIDFLVYKFSAIVAG